MWIVERRVWHVLQIRAGLLVYSVAMRKVRRKWPVCTRIIRMIIQKLKEIEYFLSRSSC